MNNVSYSLYKIIFFLSIISITFSCTTIKNYKYFQDIPDNTNITQLTNDSYKVPVIQDDDILNIIIQTLQPSSAASINEINTPGAAGFTPAIPVSGNSSPVFGYLVDKEGYVDIPVLGKIKVAGLTTEQAKDIVQAEANKYYKKASVILRFANFKITVIGEVLRPGTYVMPNERVSLLDALGYAGDLTIYGDRTNVLLLRKTPGSSGETTATRLDLTSSRIIRSPYFYLQQNDVLYITPNKTKVTSSDATQTRNISIFTAVLSLVIIVVTRIK